MNQPQQEIKPTIHSVNDVVNFMLDYEYERGANWDLTNLKLQKLAYFAQGLCLAQYNKRLFKERIEAWPYGPLIPRLYGQLRVYGSSVVTSPLADVVPITVNSDEGQTIIEIMDAFAHKAASELVNISHLSQSPWAKVWRSGLGQSAEITVEHIAAYFKAVLNQEPRKENE